MANFEVSLNKGIKNKEDFDNLINFFESIAGILEYPFSNLGLNPISRLIKNFSFIFGESSGIKFFNNLLKTKENKLSFYLLGDSDSFMYEGKGVKSFKGYVKPFINKIREFKEVAGLLPSTSNDTTPYIFLYDLKDINEGMELVSIPIKEIIQALGMENILYFLNKVLSILKITKGEVKDENLERVFKELIQEIKDTDVKYLVEKLFPVPIFFEGVSEAVGQERCEIVYPFELFKDLNSAQKRITYSELKKPLVNAHYELELINFEYNYSNLIIVKILNMILQEGKSIPEVISFIDNELKLIQNFESSVIKLNFVDEYISQINNINKSTDFVRFSTNESLDTNCYPYTNYFSNMDTIILINLKDVNFRDLVVEEPDNKKHMSTMAFIIKEIYTRIEFKYLGENFERDAYTKDLNSRVNYISYTFNSNKNRLNIVNFYPFPPLIEIPIITELFKTEVPTKKVGAREVKKVIASREGLIAIESVLMAFTDDMTSNNGFSRLAINDLFVLNIARQVLALKASLKYFLEHYEGTEDYIGGMLERYTFYKIKGKESKSVLSILSTILNLLDLLKTKLPEAWNFLSKSHKGLKDSYLSFDNKNISLNKLIKSEEYINDRAFFGRLLLSSKVIWDAIKFGKNLLYVRQENGEYETFFNYLNIKDLESWGYEISLEELIKKRESCLEEVETFIPEEGVRGMTSSKRTEIYNNRRFLILDLDLIRIAKEVKEKKIDIVLSLPGSMVSRLYNKNRIEREKLTISNVFDFIYFDFGSESVENMASIDLFVHFLYFLLGKESVVTLLLNEFYTNSNADYIIRIFNRMLYRNKKEVVVELLKEIEIRDIDFYERIKPNFGGIL